MLPSPLVKSDPRTEHTAVLGCACANAEQGKEQRCLTQATLSGTKLPEAGPELVSLVVAEDTRHGAQEVTETASKRKPRTSMHTQSCWKVEVAP